MTTKNLHTEKLFPYIYFAPDKIHRKFYNFHGKETINRFYNPNGNSSFMGLLFYDNKVLCYNIHIYPIDETEPVRSLDITEIFNQLLREYNIFHLSYLFHRALFKYYRENALTENILPYIRNQNESTLKPKFSYAVSKHRGRHRLFIENKIGENKREWDRILLRAIRKDSAGVLLREYSKERPDLFNSPYKILPKVNTATYQYDSTKDLRKSIAKRRRKLGADLQRRRSFRRGNTNFRLK